MKRRRLCMIFVFILLIIAVWIFWKRSNKTINLDKYSADDYAFGNAKGALKPLTGEKIVHLDLKGAPPNIPYYEKLFPLLSQLGATGLLIEYEDMFPYSGLLLQNVSALNAYTRNDIRSINRLAKQHNLHVTPLVQTFGHLEFLLKLREFRHLREVSEYPQAICPTHTETVDLLTDMLEQVIELHPDSEMIHIGADEVYFLGMCDRCYSTITRLNWSKQQLFLQHVRRIAQKIKEKHRNLRVLMWDDMFRTMTKSELKKSQIDAVVEPVIWMYTRDVYEKLGPKLWDMYAKVFSNVWVASSFKGATGSSQYVTDSEHHVENHRSWMSVVGEYGSRLNFEVLSLFLIVIIKSRRK